jgi:hypothetical protein
MESLLRIILMMALDSHMKWYGLCCGGVIKIFFLSARWDLKYINDLIRRLIRLAACWLDPFGHIATFSLA